MSNEQDKKIQYEQSDNNRQLFRSEPEDEVLSQNEDLPQQALFEKNSPASYWKNGMEDTWSYFLDNLKWMTNLKWLFNDPFYKETGMSWKNRYILGNEAKELLKTLKQRTKSQLLGLLDKLKTEQDDSLKDISSSEILAWLKAIDTPETVNEEEPIPLLDAPLMFPGWDSSNYYDYPVVDTKNKNFLQYSFQFYQLEDEENEQVSENPILKLHKELESGFKALEFFTTEDKNKSSEKVFPEDFFDNKQKIVHHTSIESVFQRLTESAQQLLIESQVFDSPVPVDGFQEIFSGTESFEDTFRQLTDFSLIEKSVSSKLEIAQFCCAPIVIKWLHSKGRYESENTKKQAALYHQYLLNTSCPSFFQAQRCYYACKKAGEFKIAHQTVLKMIAAMMKGTNLQRDLLEIWLLPILKEPEITEIKSAVWNLIGNQYLYLGDYEAALRYLESSLTLRQKTQNNQGEANTLNNISALYYAQGDYKQAKQYLSEALNIQQTIGDKQGEANTLNNISALHYSRGEYGNALDYLKEAVVIQQEINDKHGKGTSLNNIAQVHNICGKYDKALSYLQQALLIRREIDDKHGEGVTLNSISHVYGLLGEHEQALQCLKELLEIHKENNDKEGECKALNKISALCHELGKPEQALKYFKQSISVHHELSDAPTEEVTLPDISEAFNSRFDYDRVLEYLKQSLEVRQKLGDKQGESTTLNNISIFYHARKDYDKALEHLWKSFKIQQELEDQSELCLILFNIGEIYWQKRDEKEAISAWNSSYQIAKEVSSTKVLNAMNNVVDQLHKSGIDFWKECSKVVPSNRLE